MYLVGTGNDGEYANNRIYYCNPGTSTPNTVGGKNYEEAVMGDIVFDSWSILPQCDLILIATNNCDMNICVEQLAKVLGNDSIIQFRYINISVLTNLFR